MTLDVIPAPSPNFDARTAPPDMIVMHYTGMKSGEEALARLRDPDARVSSHYLVEEDGRIFSLVAEERRAWHAGRGSWRGETNCNAVSVGIEIVNPGHEFGYRPFPETQIAAVIALTSDIRDRWQVPNNRIIGHSDLAPARKQDPGELFPWKRLAEAGHGLWAEADPAPGDPLAEGAEGVGVFALQAGLTRLGYDCAPSGQFDQNTREVVMAFQRHWVQSRFDGVADGLTRARLMAVIRAAAAQ
ncbi:N-acetylmuramoyl-L-alanine amidase [Caulobacter sp. NIBR1757]|uniref:N-acetylmuramoyl-L-alanine amidase n=1 Tax=Caulobacter sp. NIBR1757 TaxID=3016000 RepID=UPI0022F1049B|nr:N-acetylmuramoyl-L-alanine amidase [Caulobacter sp. NIBR1757]WGM38624.1 N-acetylmuramoyl-L-alanine amidase AmiD [Caulobacter sp. NIBR1757]